MSDRRPLCLEPVLLSSRERAVVRGLTAATGSAELRCALETGHGQEHAAIVAEGASAAGETCWWLRWWPGRRVMEAKPRCGSTVHIGEAGADIGSCGFPAGHEGGHGFDLAAVPSRPASVDAAAGAFDMNSR